MVRELPFAMKDSRESLCVSRHLGVLTLSPCSRQDRAYCCPCEQPLSPESLYKIIDSSPFSPKKGFCFVSPPKSHGINIKQPNGCFLGHLAIQGFLCSFVLSLQGSYFCPPHSSIFNLSDSQMGLFLSPSLLPSLPPSLPLSISESHTQF